MKVIMISGKSMSGKDTVANIIKESLDKERILTIHFADLVKFYAAQYFNWNGNKDEDGRFLLQWIGTHLMREAYPTYWAEIVGKFIDAITETDKFDIVLIPDWRFINEYETVYDYSILQNNEVITIRVERLVEGKPFINPNMTEEQFNHISECELDNFSFDWIIENSGSIEDLRDSVNYILENL